MSFDILLKGARVVDPIHHLDGLSDIGVSAGKIVCVDDEIQGDKAREVIDLSGLLAMPGVIDGHVHVSSWLGGPQGYKMMARAGTVTAIDFAGPFDNILTTMKNVGHGLNIGGIEAIRPGLNVPSNDPSPKELRDFIKTALDHGAIGIKILGGHFPMTPDATANAIRLANEEKAYVAFHVGTTTHERSDLTSLEQALELSNGYRLHICHVCTCCLGLVLGDPFEEIKVMMEMLAKYPNVVTESHLSVPAYSLAEFTNGRPSSNSSAMFMEMAGYSLSPDGLHQAMHDGYITAVKEIDDENIIVEGEQGYRYWLAGEVTTLGFKANLPISIIASAIHKRSDGLFSVDALASDGGGIPRNNLLTSGVALVQLGSMSFADLVTKISVAPARMYGLMNKGHFGEGADADITVIDPQTGKAIYAFASGKVILRNSVPCGVGANLITTDSYMGPDVGSRCERPFLKKLELI